MGNGNRSIRKNVLCLMTNNLFLNPDEKLFHVQYLILFICLNFIRISPRDYDEFVYFRLKCQQFHVN